MFIFFTPSFNRRQAGGHIVDKKAVTVVKAVTAVTT